MEEEQTISPAKERELLAKKLVDIAKKQIDACVNFKRPRIADIQKNENLYNNKAKKVLKGRYNIPLPIMSGFIDTLMAKTDERVAITFGYTDEADYKRAKKITSAWEIESSPQMGNWDKVDRSCKRQAALSGLGIYKFYAQSDPKYKSTLYVPDIYDFIFEPNGGNNIENHLFCGEKNIFKTKSELKEGVKIGLYDLQGVRILLNHSNNDLKESEDAYNEKSNRFKSLNLDPVSNNYVGQPIFSLNEHYLNYAGKRYYLLFDYKSGAVIRFEELSNVFESGLYPYTTWQTNEDAFNLFTKAPADDIRPVAVAMNEMFNQMLENVEKRGWNQRIINPDMFSDLSEFNWRPNGLIKLKPGEARNIGDGVFEFKVDDTSVTVTNIFGFLDQFLGQKTGITQNAQGSSGNPSDKVGIYYGEMQQVADRLGLQNKSYTEAQTRLGYLYYCGLKEHLSEEMMIKMIGDKGVEWDKLRKEDLNFTSDPNILVISANNQADVIKQDKKQRALSELIASPYAQKLNPDLVIEQKLLSGGWEIDEIKTMTDLENKGNKETIGEAKQLIQDVLGKKPVKINRGATMAYCQYILDYSVKDEITVEQSKFLQDWVVKHLKIAMDNERRKVRQMTMNNVINSMSPMAPAQQNMPQSMPQNMPITDQQMADQRPSMEGVAV